MPQGTHSPFRGPAALPESLLGLSGKKETSAGAVPAAPKSGALTAGGSVGALLAKGWRQFLALNVPQEP